MDKYNLLPGTYEIKISYSEFSGLGYRASEPETYQIELEKDYLRIIPTNPFSEPLEMGYEYGTIYTFEYDVNGTLFWRSVFDGKVVNSLNEGVQVDYFNNI